jgi:hypothetical protein
MITLRTTLAALCAASLSAPLLAGEAVEHTFRATPENGRGITSMADLRGRPVLIDFWGTR